MAERQHPMARVKLYEAGQEYGARYDGFGRYDLAGDLVGQNRVWINQVEAGVLGLWAGEPYRASFPAAMHVGAEGLNSVICRPFLDTGQGVGLGHFAAEGGQWRALKGLGLGAEVKLFQEDGTCNQITGLRSRFTLPTNPMFAVSLWRAEPGREHDWSRPPYTEIHFGIGEQEEWALGIPYGAPVFLMRRVGGQWQRLPYSEKSVRMPTLEGNARGQRSWLWFGVLRGKAVLSTDGFVEEVSVCEAPEGPVHVARGPVSLWHNAGQWAFSFFPVKMAAARVHSGAVETGYLTQESSGESFVQVRGIPVRDDRGTLLTAAVGADDTAERPGLSSTQRSWRVEITPFEHRENGVGTDPESGASVDFATWVSPEWLATQMGQQAEVTESAGPAAVEISRDVRGLRLESQLEQGANLCQIELDNQPGDYAEVGEYRRMEVELGWRREDGSEDLVAVASGPVVEPPLTTLAGAGSSVRLNVLDPMLRLRDEKADGRTPVFDGWPVVEVFRWVLGRCGIPTSRQQLEDTGTTLSLGSVERPAWEVEVGRSWTEFLAAVARFDYNAGFYFDGAGIFHKGCRHCRQPRPAAEVTQHTGAVGSACGSEVRWELHTRGSIAPDPAGEGEVLGLRRTRHSLSGEEYANWVTVCGLGADGQMVRAVAFDREAIEDPDNDRYVGWRKMDVWAVAGQTTAAEVQRLALDRLAELQPRPEHIVVSTPLLPEAAIGQVLRIHGAEQVGAGGQLYRVTGLEHEVSRLPDRVAVTTLQARWIGAEED